MHADFSCELYFMRHGESILNATPGLDAGRDRVSGPAPLSDAVHPDLSGRAMLHATLAMGGPWPVGTLANQVAPDRVA